MGRVQGSAQVLNAREWNIQGSRTGRKGSRSHPGGAGGSGDWGQAAAVTARPKWRSWPISVPSRMWLKFIWQNLRCD